MKMEMEMVPDRKQAEKGKCNQQQGKRERKKGNHGSACAMMRTTD